ncbi:MAG: adenylate/guanylate cyclase domain-containing protein [Candidatus Ozemobacteraceae bacterium]
MTDTNATVGFLNGSPNSSLPGKFGEEEKQCILAVDDSPDNIEIIRNLLGKDYQIKAATRGRKAIEIAKRKPHPDLILLDVMMPEMDGYEVCRCLKADPETAHIPVVFVTGKNETANELEGFELGATDYIAKPFHPAIIKARVHTHLLLQKEQKKVEQLLENILPHKVIQDLKEHGFSSPHLFDPVTVMFADLVGFTPAAAKISPEQLIRELTDMFTTLDGIVAKHGAERIKTIGDAYLAVCGMPIPNSEHAAVMVRVAMDFFAFLETYNRDKQKCWKIRIGLDTGPVVGGIVGRRRYLYDIFGDAVNTAARVQTAAQPMSLMVTEKTWNLVKGLFPFIHQGLIDLKGKGPMSLYALAFP